MVIGTSFPKTFQQQSSLLRRQQKARVVAYQPSSQSARSKKYSLSRDYVQHYPSGPRYVSGLLTDIPQVACNMVEIAPVEAVRSSISSLWTLFSRAQTFGCGRFRPGDGVILCLLRRFFSAPDRPIEPILLSLGPKRGHVHDGGALG